MTILILKWNNITKSWPISLIFSLKHDLGHLTSLFSPFSQFITKNLNKVRFLKNTSKIWLLTPSSRVMWDFYSQKNFKMFQVTWPPSWISSLTATWSTTSFSWSPGLFTRGQSRSSFPNVIPLEALNRFEQNYKLKSGSEDRTSK